MGVKELNGMFYQAERDVEMDPGKGVAELICYRRDPIGSVDLFLGKTLLS